jgi:hypothetical protein
MNEDEIVYMKTIRVVLLSVVLASVTAALPGEDISSNFEREIIAKISARVLPAYIKYIGVECKREIVSRQYDYRDDSFLGTYTVVLNRKEFFYKRAKYKVLKFVKNGKEESTWKYNYPTRTPPYQPFDADTDKNYTIKLIGKKAINGVLCWELDVIPKKKSSRHLKGKIYFTCGTLDLFFLKGTVARLPIGVKSLDIEMYFKKLDDACVASHGTYTFCINFPLIYPHMKFVQSFTSTEDRLIPAKTDKK